MASAGINGKCSCQKANTAVGLDGLCFQFLLLLDGGGHQVGQVVHHVGVIGGGDLPPQHGDLPLQLGDVVVSFFDLGDFLVQLFFDPLQGLDGLVGLAAVYQGLGWKAIQRRWHLQPAMQR